MPVRRKLEKNGSSQGRTTNYDFYLLWGFWGSGCGSHGAGWEGGVGVGGQLIMWSRALSPLATGSGSFR